MEARLRFLQISLAENAMLFPSSESDGHSDEITYAIYSFNNYLTCFRLQLFGKGRTFVRILN